MEEGCEEVGVVDCDRQFLEDVLVSQTALLKTKRCVRRCFNRLRYFYKPVCGEFALLERRDEQRRQSECTQADSSLHTSARVVYQRHRLLGRLFLVEELVLNHVCVDKVAHARACVPSNVVRINIHVPY